MKVIQKIVLHNFKRFRYIEIPCNENLNIFIGDNESGKSTLLQAIDLVSRGSYRRVEDIGLNRLFNTDAVREFMASDRNYNNLPKIIVELYLAESGEISLAGTNNTQRRECEGLAMVCEPDEGYSSIIVNSLRARDATFPFEFYKIDFHTFGGTTYNGHTRKHISMTIDTLTIGNQYSMDEYVHDLYSARTTKEQQLQLRHNYHIAKEQFVQGTLRTFLPNGSNACQFSIKDNSSNNIETALTLQYDGVPVENKGTGQLCFIKMELALKSARDSVDAILIEEPENHLSYAKMLQLIRQIQNTTNKQLFICTHSDMIATRLDLRKCTMLSGDLQRFVQLRDISEETAKFFMKAPDNNMLQYVLAKKALLVEGDAEYILMDKFVKSISGQSLEEIGIAVIAVDGRCFKRYLEIARILGIKTAVVTDNDGDYDVNIIQNYADYTSGQYPNIRIFSEANNELYTYEASIYSVNETVCDRLFSGATRTRTVLEYMLANKSEVAYRLSIAEEQIIVPQYISNAIQWLMS